MANKTKKHKDNFFTIKTPKKDSSILDQFLSEFGYSAFETEERPDDSRRSVKQVSRNDELIEEVADFCRENSCSIYLIYKDNGMLMEQLFRGKQVYNPKEYKSSDPTPKNHTLKVEEGIQNFLDNNTSQKQKNNSNNKNNKQNKNNYHKKNKRIGVMSDHKPRKIENKTETADKSMVQIKRKRRKIN